MIRMPTRKNKRPTISVVLATFNEEKNIVDCLKSVKDWVDEIIVVDEQSTDKTVELARKMGAQVFVEPHEQIFHITKNKAINRSKGDWVIQLDADERITPEMKKEILGIVEGTYFGYDNWISPLKKKLNKIIKIFPEPQKLTRPASAYWLPRRNWFLTTYLYHGGQYPDPVIRFFQRGKAILPAKDVHEQMKVDGQVGWLRSDLDHLSTPTFSHYLRRENRYAAIQAGIYKKSGVKVNFFNTINYLFIKPFTTFIKLYFRHRGFLDGFPGFVFALYSGFHHAFSYMKLWELDQNN